MQFLDALMQFPGYCLTGPGCAKNVKKCLRKTNHMVLFMRGASLLFSKSSVSVESYL